MLQCGHFSIFVIRFCSSIHNAQYTATKRIPSLRIKTKSSFTITVACLLFFSSLFLFFFWHTFFFVISCYELTPLALVFISWQYCLFFFLSSNDVDGIQTFIVRWKWCVERKKNTRIFLSRRRKSHRYFDCDENHSDEFEWKKYHTNTHRKNRFESKLLLFFCFSWFVYCVSSRSNIWDGNFEYVTKRKIVLLHATVCLYGNSLTLWATISCRDAERPDFSVEKCMNIFWSHMTNDF